MNKPAHPGNDAIAFAKVEMRFRGKSAIGADPVLVVLRREGSHWKAFSVGDDIFCIRALPDLCRLGLRPHIESAAAPPTPELLHPKDDAKLTATLRSFAWEIPAGGSPLAAQVGEVLLDEKGSSWPMSRIKVCPGEPRGRSLPVAEPALTGVTSDEMRLVCLGHRRRRRPLGVGGPPVSKVDRIPDADRMGVSPISLSEGLRWIVESGDAHRRRGIPGCTIMIRAANG